MTDVVYHMGGNKYETSLCGEPWSRALAGRWANCLKCWREFHQLYPQGLDGPRATRKDGSNGKGVKDRV